MAPNRRLSSTPPPLRVQVSPASDASVEVTTTVVISATATARATIACEPITAAVAAAITTWMAGPE